MRRLAALVLLPALLVGCSSTEKSNSSSTDNYTPTTAKPTGELDTLKWGLPSTEPATLDWIYDWDYGASNQILANTCEGLTRQNPDGSITPALASAMAAPDPTTYVYTLRQGVTFSDGKPMTAEDVAFSLNRNLTADPPSYWAIWYTNVQSVTATNATTVTVKLKKPDALFPRMMNTPAGYVGEKAYIQAAGAKYGTSGGGVMCTGPFSLASWVKGQSITLKRNENYWDASLKAKSKTVVMSFIPDASAMNSALLTGEIDGASGMNSSSLKALERSTTGKLYTNKGTEVVVMQLNDLTTGPLKDKRIREALRYVIDYKGITQGLMGGRAEPVKSSTPEATWGYEPARFRAGDAALPGGVQDLKQAKELVKQAGAPSQPIVIAVNADVQSIVNAATSVQASAKSVGLNVQVKKYPAQEFTNLFYDEKARSAVSVMLNNVTADVPDPLEVVAQVIPGSPFNYTKIDDTALASTITQATEATDDASRAKLTVAATKTITDQVYSIPLYSIDARVYLNDKVTGTPVTTLSQWYYPWAATVGAR